MNKLFIRAEQTVDLGEVRITGAWLADSRDVERDSQPYEPSCRLGDWLVAMIGYDSGSVEWVENWGEAPSDLFTEMEVTC